MIAFTHTHTHIYIYICVCVYVRMCVLICDNLFSILFPSPVARFNLPSAEAMGAGVGKEKGDEIDAIPLLMRNRLPGMDNATVCV